MRVVVLLAHMRLLLLQIGDVLLVDGRLRSPLLLLQVRDVLLFGLDLLGERLLILRLTLALLVDSLLLLLR